MHEPLRLLETHSGLITPRETVHGRGGGKTRAVESLILASWWLCVAPYVGAFRCRDTRLDPMARLRTTQPPPQSRRLKWSHGAARPRSPFWRPRKPSAQALRGVFGTLAAA